MEIDYSNLIQQYENGLLNNLRNFQAGPTAFLDLWVPDEDLTQSLISLFDSASIAGFEGLLKILFSPSDIGGIKQDTLIHETMAFGKLEISQTKTQAWVSLVFTDKQLSNVHPAYQRGLEEALKDIRFERDLSQAPSDTVKDHKLLIHSGDQGNFALEIDSKGMIVSACHWGSEGALRAFLDKFCEMITSIPIQEASDHGVLRLENRLRNRSVSAPVKGILTPDNADPVFQTIQTFIRCLYRRFLEGASASTARNTFTQVPSQKWRTLKDEEKLRLLEQSLIEGCRNLGIQFTGIEIVGLQGKRVILGYTQDPQKPRWSDYLIKLEQILQEKVDPTLELSLESKEDNNQRHRRNPPPGQVEENLMQQRSVEDSLS